MKTYGDGGKVDVYLIQGWVIGVFYSLFNRVTHWVEACVFIGASVDTAMRARTIPSPVIEPQLSRRPVIAWYHMYIDKHISQRCNYIFTNFLLGTVKKNLKAHNSVPTVLIVQSGINNCFTHICRSPSFYSSFLWWPVQQIALIISPSFVEYVPAIFALCSRLFYLWSNNVHNHVSHLTAFSLVIWRQLLR
jgi:hypothetical protein